MQLGEFALPPGFPYSKVGSPYRSTCFRLQVLSCEDLLSLSIGHLRLIAEDHPRTLYEWYMRNNNLRVPIIKAPIPKARVIFASAEKDTSETLSLSDKIGGRLAAASRNILFEDNVAYGSALHVLLDFQLLFLLIFEMLRTAHLLYI